MAVPTASEVLAEADRALAESPRIALCQIVRVEGSTPGKRGWKMLLRPDGSCYGNLGGGAFEALVQRDAAKLLEESEPQSKIERYYLTEDSVKGQPTGMVCGGMIEVFLEVLTARPMLVICGGGPVGQALARQAALCDFEISVADDRGLFRRPELFPDSSRILEVDREYSGDFLDSLAERDLSIAVVSRCWQTDLAALASVLRQAPPGLRYLGLMGSQRKVARVTAELAARGFELSGLPWHAPIGLSIGGSTPAEIAVSIVGEILQEMNRDDASGFDNERPVRLV